MPDTETSLDMIVYSERFMQIDDLYHDVPKNQEKYAQFMFEEPENV